MKEGQSRLFGPLKKQRLNFKSQKKCRNPEGESVSIRLEQGVRRVRYIFFLLFTLTFLVFAFFSDCSMLSVIIPTYNRSSFLREAIQSVFDQDYFLNTQRSSEFEMIVVDDGSTDDTQEIVTSLGGPVDYCFQEHRGVSAARNRGLQMSRGKHIAFLDSDDLWMKNKLAVQMSYMKAFPATVVCYTDEIWIRNGVFVNPRKRHRKYSGWIFDKVLPLCLLSLSSAVFRREVFEEIGPFDETLPACEDYDFGIRVAQRFPIRLISCPLIVKRGGHEDQLSKKYWGMDRFRITALEKALNLDLSPEQESLVRREIVRKARILAKGFQSRNRKKEAAEYCSLIDKYE